MRVVGAQMRVTRDVRQNSETIRRAIGFAASAEADILLTPEGSLSGYTPDFERDAVAKALDQVTSLAREENLGLALGTCFMEPDGKTYNQIRFSETGGAYLGFHSKILRCANLNAPQEGEINSYAASPLRTFPFRGVEIGGLICNDLWANPACTPFPDPHLSQQLSDMGARVIFHAVNGGRRGNEWSRVNWNYHESNLRMRARAGKLWIVTVDNCNPTDIPCSAPSGVIDPEGNWVCRAADQGEEFFVHTIRLTNRSEDLSPQSW